MEIELVPNLVIDGLRDADGAGLGQRFKPGSDVDPIAENVVAVDDHVAKVDADPQFETTLGRERVVDRTRRLLHRDGAAERVDDAGKIRQQAVSRGADDPPAMRRDQRIDGGAQLAQRPMRAGLVLAHQAAEPRDIGMQDGGELPLTGG